jgi:hypothetical protein
MAQCIKTGATVHLIEWNSWIHADIFQVSTQSDTGHMAHVYVIKSSSRPNYLDPPPFPFTHEAKVGHGFMHESKDANGTIIVVSAINLKDLKEAELRA